MGAIEALKKGFGVATGSMPLVIVLFVFGLIWNVLNIFLAPETPEGATVQQSVFLVAGGIIFILLTIFVQGGSMAYIRDKIKKGAAEFSVFTQSGTRYYLRLLAIGLVIGLVVGIFVLLASLTFALLQQTAAAAGIAVAVVFGLIGLAVVILMFLAPYIVVTEEAKAIDSIKRSVTFVKKQLWPVLGMFGLLIVMGFAFGLVVGLVYALIGLAVPEGRVSQIIFSILSGFVNSFLGVIVTASFLAYYLANSGSRSAANSFNS